MKSSLRNYGVKTKIALVAAIVLTGCFFSCSRNVKSTSLTSTLDEIDRYIVQGQTDSAVKLLDKTDRKSLPPAVRLGIYRRYIQLDEKTKAEKLIKSCLKNNPDNKEIIAVYSSLLMKQGNLKDALSLSKKLTGTEYGSIYAEALLRTVISSAGSSVTFVNFCIPEYTSVFFDAYTGSKDTAWLRNCAAICILRGNMEQALSYVPSEFKDAQDAYFWSLICYDSKKFVEASENLKIAKDLVNREISDTFEIKKVLKEKQNLSLKIRSLLADSYVSLSEEKLAETERNSLLEYLTSLDEEVVIEEENFPVEYRIPGVDLLSVIYLNSALWSLSKEDYKGAYKLLSFEVDKWPDYAPGLIAYGNFAYNSNLVSLDDPMTQELRKLGVRSLDMKEYDELPKVPVSDAIARMQDSLARFKNFQLYVAMLDLEDKVEQSAEKVHLAKIYHTLERNTLGTNLYPPEICRYAVHGLVSHDKKEEAEFLFTKYLAKRYNFSEKSSYYDEVFKHIHQMETWEIEYSAWFAANEKNATLAAGLYEFIVFNEYLKDEKQVKEISPRATVAAMQNLAMIYSSTSRKDEAISLYGKASNYARTSLQKSECLYRIGVLYNERKQVLDAVKSLKYALYLNPSHSKARLLLAQINK